MESARRGERECTKCGDVNPLSLLSTSCSWEGQKLQKRFSFFHFHFFGFLFFGILVCGDCLLK
jgi:hypothetical protein